MIISKKDSIKFCVVMALFLIGSVLMALKGFKNLWVWTGYIIVWSWAQMKAAKKMHLPWWVWVIIITIIYLFIAALLNYLT